MITIIFKCGHIHTFTGDESVPICHCGERIMMNVNARAPRFRGLANGPCAQYEELPPEPVTLTKDPAP